MPTYHEDDLIANGIRLHYYRAGAGPRSIVLAHGLTDAGLCWGALAEQLAPDYTVVLYDARGHGCSEQPAAGYDYDTLAADMAGLIGALGLERPIVLGHSMGAATAALAAARYPALFGGVALEDPPARTEQTSAEALAMATQWHADVAAQRQLSRAELIARARAESPRWPAAELGPWADAKRQVLPDAVYVAANPATVWHSVIEQITCPVLLITGDPAQGALVTPEFATSLAARWRHGRVAHIPGAGHCIRRDQPALFMQALRDFLADLALDR